MQFTYSLGFLFAIFAAALAGCGNDQEPRQQAEGEATYIVAVNNPLAYFTRRLIGGEIEVRLPAPADGDPALWQPAVEDVLQLQGAELLILNGAGYSPWLDKVSISSLRLVNTGESVRKRWIALDSQVTHSHGPQGEHAHGDYAFTLWMDMSLARAQAESIATALKARWPQFAPRIDENFAGLSRDLEELDSDYRQWTRALAGRQLFYSHPVYQYFQRAYEADGHSLHWEPDAMPTEEQWAELGRALEESPLFIWEAEPDPAIARRMSAMGLAFVVVDPAANAGELDWLAKQRNNLALRTR